MRVCAGTAKMTKVTFPKLTQDRIACGIRTARTRMDDKGGLNKENRPNKIGGTAPRFTRNLVGRLYIDSSLFSLKRQEQIEKKRVEKHALKAARMGEIMAKELAEIEALNQQISARQAIKKRQEVRRRKKAILDIQRYYRGHLGRRLVATLRAEKAATKLQSVFRSSQVRTNIETHRKQNAQLTDVLFEGHLAVELINDTRRELAILVIQTAIRMRLSKNYVWLLRTNRAALKIQRLVRGHLGRLRGKQLVLLFERERLKSELFITQLRPMFKDSKMQYMKKDSLNREQRGRPDTTEAKKILQAAKRNSAGGFRNTAPVELRWEKFSDKQAKRIMGEPERNATNKHENTTGTYAVDNDVLKPVSSSILSAPTFVTDLAPTEMLDEHRRMTRSDSVVTDVYEDDFEDDSLMHHPEGHSGLGSHFFDDEEGAPKSGSGVKTKRDIDSAESEVYSSDAVSFDGSDFDDALESMVESRNPSPPLKPVYIEQKKRDFGVLVRTDNKTKKTDDIRPSSPPTITYHHNSGAGMALHSNTIFSRKISPIRPLEPKPSGGVDRGSFRRKNFSSSKRTLVNSQQ